MRTALSVLAALLPALLAAGPRPAAAGRAVSADEARSRLETASARCEIRSLAAAPLRLRALVRALRLSTGDHAGRYELSWEGPDRWRQEIRFAGYHRLDLRDGEGEWISSDVPWTPVRVSELREGLDVAALLSLQGGERVMAAESVRAAEGRRLLVELAGGRRGPRQIELDEESGLPVSVRERRLGFRFEAWEAVGDARYPREIEVSDDEGTVATVSVRRLAREPSLSPDLFRRPGDARRIGSCPEPGEPEWESYRERLATFFRRGWRLPREAQLGLEGVTRLGFAVRRDGEVLGLRVLESSGSPALDAAALAAVAAAAPLPSPPLGESSEALEIAWTVAYNVEERPLPRPKRLQGERPVTGSGLPGTEAIDELMTSFLEEADAPGAALAVMAGSRLLLARGYGWADAESREPVQPDSLFRIASLSKALTAMAIVGCAEDGRLRLDDSPWRSLGLEEVALAADPRHGRLTIEHLLQHRGGFDSRLWGEDEHLLAAENGRGAAGGAAMPAEAFVEELAMRPLDFEPGARFAYSNAGYAVLGRVLEAVTRLRYEDAVRERLLLPLGLEATRLGRDDGRRPGEVRAHLRDPELVPAADGSGVPVPLAEGGFSVEAMAAHGGWLSTAEELVALAAALDEPRRSGVLGRRSVRRLWERPPGRAGHDAAGRPYVSWYGCGWHVRVAGPRGELEQWHDGRLPGASALLVREADGLRWAVLFNQGRGADGTLLAAAVEPLLRERLAEWSSLAPP